jgi:hypothetical protein
MNTETTCITYACRCCGDNIEFPFNSTGQDVACPHCNLETDLLIPAPPPRSAPHPAPASKKHWLNSNATPATGEATPN